MTRRAYERLASGLRPGRNRHRRWPGAAPARSRSGRSGCPRRARGIQRPLLALPAWLIGATAARSAEPAVTVDGGDVDRHRRGRRCRGRRPERRRRPTPALPAVQRPARRARPSTAWPSWRSGTGRGRSTTMADPVQQLNFLAWVRRRSPLLAERRSRVGGRASGSATVTLTEHDVREGRPTGTETRTLPFLLAGRATSIGLAAGRGRPALPGAGHARPRIGPLPLRGAGRPGAAVALHPGAHARCYGARACIRGWSSSWAMRAPR